MIGSCNDLPFTHTPRSRAPILAVASASLRFPPTGTSTSFGRSARLSLVIPLMGKFDTRGCNIVHIVPMRKFRSEPHDALLTTSRTISVSDFEST